jgi:hypothetical protein
MEKGTQREIEGYWNRKKRMGKGTQTEIEGYWSRNKKKNSKNTDPAMYSVDCLGQGSAFLLILAHLALFFYGLVLFIVGGDCFVMKIIRETTEIKVFFSNLIKLSMKLALYNIMLILWLFSCRPLV